MQPRKLHMKRLNQTESLVHDFMCSLFPKTILFYFYLFVIQSFGGL